MAGIRVAGAAAPSSAADALAQFLRIDPRTGTSKQTMADGVGYDPSLELAGLRDSQATDFKERAINAEAGGNLPEAKRQKSFFDLLTGEADADPFTGTAALASAKAASDAHAKLAAVQTPGTPEHAAQAHQEAVDLQKAMVEHPSPNVSPFAGASNVPFVPGGVPTTGAPAGVPGAPGAAPGPIAGNHTVPAPDGVDPALWGKHTADLTPEAAGKVAALLDYREPLPSGNALARPEWATVLGRAQMLDPTFDVTQYVARQKLRDSLTSGEAGQRLRSLNQLAGHVQDLDKIRGELGNFNTGAVLNTPINAFEKHVLGAGKFTDFDSTYGAVNTELGKFLGGSHATNELRNSVGGGVTSNSSDEQIARFIHAVSDLASRSYDSFLPQEASVPRLKGLVEKQLGPAAQALIQRARGGGSTGQPDVDALIRKYGG